jgi:2-iminobutanoate/2-iminopropanoate deaminase
MARQIVFSRKAAKPPATYSQAVKAAGLVFVSGTAPADPNTGAIKGSTVQEQTAQCLSNIQAILEEAGSSLDKIVSVTVVLADEDDFAGMNEEWLKWFPANPPARQGAKLPARIPGLKVSIAAMICLPLNSRPSQQFSELKSRGSSWDRAKLRDCIGIHA